MKIKAIIFLFLVISFNLSSNQSLAVKPIESEVVEESSRNYIENELVRLLSINLDMEVFIEGGSSSSTRYLFVSELTTKEEQYSFKYELTDTKNNSSIVNGKVSALNITDILEKLTVEVINIRSILRKPPPPKDEKLCYIVINSDVTKTDIYIQGEYQGHTPISLLVKKGDKVKIEGRTETKKKSIIHTVEDSGIIEINLKLEPITGNLLLKGDVLGRTILINDKPYEIEKSSLLREIPIGKINLYIEDEWNLWSDSVFIEEEKLTEVLVEFEPVSRVNIAVKPGFVLAIRNKNNQEVFKLNESDKILIEPGEYNFISSQDGYIPKSMSLTIDPQILYEYTTPDLEVIPQTFTEDEIKASFLHKTSFWSTVSSGVLLTLGVIGELISINMYENSNVTDDSIAFRKVGENLRIINITLLSTCVVSFITYLISGRQI